ncbi:hypothetical protein EYB25_004703 [Talaromyces marneffei]|uniref:DUF4396 domain-containing protein n=1 Tax=Talaromyces marneffei (strain ATCC 18224 / CBS 334.59 / QM 7333) TaxID=441960 RepID=B6QFD0_TALMQ|nr:conserved hypothetical protein [Talaromyces marneffei ATCC 18224]KAE8553321.1 hypothetical protein EYB25_004703 [Talaromyces marneffei]
MKQNQFGLAVGLWQRRLLRGPCLTHTHRFFSSQHPSQQQCQSTKNNNACSKSSANRPYTSPKTSQPQLRSIWDSGFWTCKSTWRRARINTLRCLIGCTAGDFSALWTLQTFYPGLGMGVIMGASMASGITTSIILETILLRRGADQLSWPMAARTAMGMSMVSMLAMEAAENIVDYHLTGGVVDIGDPQFWMAATASVLAGYLAPLPYNYLRLRRYGKACH